MIFGLFILLVALSISAVAAYYSIAGLTAIFAAAVVPIIIMGAALELGKITATVWLHKYWHRANIQFKLYLIPAIIILMIITSMGIFGYLSKAHMDQTVTVGDSSAKVAILDEKILTEQDNIAANKRALQQMDAQVDQLLGRTTDDRGANRAVQVRKQQTKERKSIQADISAAQQRIAELQAERAPLAAETRKIEAEVGPVKYIAALIYGDNPDANLLERAVRWVIILLVLVFDPLALVLILAAEQTIEWAREDRKKSYPLAPPNPHKEPETPAEMQAVIDDTPPEVTEEFFERGKELAKAIDDNDGRLPEDYINSQAYLKKPWVHIPHTTDWTVSESEETESQPVIDETMFDPQPINPVYHTVAISDDHHEEHPPVSTQAGFGTEFPDKPRRGDVFLRVDYLPSRLYKWNERKWIEVDKEQSGQVSYDHEYIKHLITKIDSGEYDVELLTTAEQEQIQGYLNGTN